MDARQADATLRIVHGVHGRRIEGTNLTIGDVLEGKYRIDGVIGMGGMGIVMLALHLVLKEKVAIKVLLDTAREKPVSVARFEREARAAATLRSPHVAKVLDVGRIENVGPYLVMEYLDGSDLGTLVEGGRALSPDVAVTYVLQACDAIAEAHRLGIIHRDLKPENLFLAKRPNQPPMVKVLDFGISKVRSEREDAALTRTHDVMGSPLYMSPEQLRGVKDVDERTDIWALGAILYRLIADRPPFDGETMAQLCSRVLMERQPDIRTLRPGVPDRLAKVIEQCLEKEAGKRPASIAALVQLLTPFAPPGAATMQYEVPTEKGRGVRVVVFLGMLGVLGGGIFFWQRSVAHEASPAPSVSASAPVAPAPPPPSASVALAPPSTSTSASTSTSTTPLEVSGHPSVRPSAKPPPPRKPHPTTPAPPPTPTSTEDEAPDVRK